MCPWLGLACPKMLPNMFFGHNLHHVAPFGILEAGFCMVFRRASFCCLVPGTHFWTPEPKFGPRIWKLGPGWAGEVLGSKMGTRKTWFCEGMVSKLDIMGFPATRMDCMVPRRPLGKPVSPKTPLKNGSPRLFPISGNLGKVPLSPLWISYLPFVAPTGVGGMAEGPLYYKV